MRKAVTFQVSSEGIGYLVIDIPGQKVNTLSSPLLQELQETFNEIATKSSLKALVISSGKKDNFIAGADVKEFISITDMAVAVQMAKRGQQLFNQLASLPFPTIAIIDGPCMGGGLELALACSYRVVTDEEKTTLALPEVKLGLIPGWGGTQRLPRLVGLVQGLDMILNGKTIPATKAFKMGLADAIFPRAFLEQNVKEFIAACLDKQKQKQLVMRRGAPGLKSCLIEKNPVGRSLVFRKAEKLLLEKTKGLYPAPLAALNVIKDTYGMDLEEGLALEAQAIGRLFENQVAHNLIHLFLNSQEIKKNPGKEIEVKPKEITSAAILGAGTMGGAIAWLLSKDNYNVRLKDVNWEAIAHGLASARSIYEQLVKIKKLKPVEMRNKMARISGTVDYSGFKGSDLVIEAIVEDLKIKQEVLQEVEKVVSNEAVIASNTSALSISEMGRVLHHPERFLGIHFFNPVNRMSLVEVIPGEETSSETLATAVALLRKLGKTPIIVADRPGFLVNRILLPYLNEACWMLEEGIDYEHIDKLMLEFGMPMGPFQLMDEVGLDVAYKAAKTLENAFGQRAKVANTIHVMIEKGLKGKKAGGGFYLDNKKQRYKNPAVSHLLSSRRIKTNYSSDADIIDRCILGMVNEASRALEEKVVANAALLDMAMILGTGFPPFRGGLLAYADRVGIDDIVKRLQQLAKTVHDRFTPSAYLLQLQKDKKKFTSI